MDIVHVHVPVESKLQVAGFARCHAAKGDSGEVTQAWIDGSSWTLANYSTQHRCTNLIYFCLTLSIFSVRKRSWQMFCPRIKFQQARGHPAGNCFLQRLPSFLPPISRLSCCWCEEKICLLCQLNIHMSAWHTAGSLTDAIYPAVWLCSVV